MRKLEKYENQFCKLSNPNSSEKLNPINMILNDIQPFKLSNKKTYNESNIVLSIDEIMHLMILNKLKALDIILLTLLK